MELLLERIFTCSTYTIGKLYVNNVFFCDVLEDTDRGLRNDMTLEEIKKIKVQNETAIPIGKYDVSMLVKSPKYSNFSKYVWSKKYDGYLPRLVDVKGFDGILAHVGNTPGHSSGCLLFGLNTIKGQLTNSTATFTKLMDEYLVPAKNRKEKITIEIRSKYKK